MPEEQHQEASEPAEGSESARSGSAKVLVVDDVALMRSLLARALSREGYDVLEARHGKLGLELARREKPDLILLDSMMPVMSGPECLHALKSSPETAGIPVIMCTARSEKPDVVEAAKLGAVDYVIKPFDIETVLERVKKHLPGA